VGLFLLCFLPRFVCLLLFRGSLFPVEFYWQYWDAATRYLHMWKTWRWEGVSEVREPLYSLFLALLRGITGERVLYVSLGQILFSCVGCVYLYKLTLLLSGRQKAAVIAGALYALYPFLVLQAMQFNYLTFTCVLLILAAYHYSAAGDLRGCIRCGFVFGLSALARLVIVPAWLLGILLLAFRRRVLHAAVITGCMGLLLLPFFSAGHSQQGALLPTRNGVNLFKGNSEYTDLLVPRYTVDLLDSTLRALLRERGLPAKSLTSPAADRHFAAEAWRFIRIHPFRTIRRKLLNVAYLFSPAMIPRYLLRREARLAPVGKGDFRVEGAFRRTWVKELLYVASYTPLLILGIAGFLMRKPFWWKDRILLAIAGCFIGVHALYFSTTFHRVPMDFILIFYSACVLDRWFCQA